MVCSMVWSMPEFTFQELVHWQTLRGTLLGASVVCGICRGRLWATRLHFWSHLALKVRLDSRWTLSTFCSQGASRSVPLPDSTPSDSGCTLIYYFGVDKLIIFSICTATQSYPTHFVAHVFWREFFQAHQLTFQVEWVSACKLQGYFLY